MNFGDDNKGNMFMRMKMQVPFVKPTQIQSNEPQNKIHKYSRK